MSGFLDLSDTIEPRYEMPYVPWFEMVSPMLDLYPPEAMAELYFELECSDMGKQTVDNWFVTSYNNVGDFTLEVPDD